MSETVYLNGRFIPYEDALVPIEDRGMLFADGIYEVVRAYGGRLFTPEAHIERLVASAAEIGLRIPPSDELLRAMTGVFARSGLEDSSIYLQITRGFAGPRSHAVPRDVTPTVFAAARPVPRPHPDHVQYGAVAITVPDRRWHMCHVKSVGLLLNTLAKQAAMDAGAQEALFLREGILTEGSATNAFVVRDGQVHTHPEGPHVLSGITRQIVLELCAEGGIPVREELVPCAQVYSADEVFVTGTNTEVLPIRQVDGRTIGNGGRGPLTARLQEFFARRVGLLSR